MKKFTKLLSFICALALIVSCVSVSFVASAAATLSTSCYTMTKNSTAFFTNHGWGDNHLTTATATASAFDGSNSAELTIGAAAYDKNITGGAILSAANAGLDLTETNNTTTQTDAYLQMEFTLANAIDNPTDILYVNHYKKGNAQYMSKHYAVFASSTAAELYTAPVFEYTLADGEDPSNIHVIDISSLNLKKVKYVAIRLYHRGYNKSAMHVEEFGLFGGEIATEEEESPVTLEASVFDSKQGVNANDIMYKVDTSAVTGEITDMGIISGFKVNIDADAGVQPDAKPEEYAEYLKTAPATAVKVSATAEQLTNENLFFHIHNSGKHNENDYSGYIVCTIAYVTVMESGTPTTYYSNVITKSSMQISRNQAKVFQEGGKVVAGYEEYNFANDGNIDIAKVREFVEA